MFGRVNILRNRQVRNDMCTIYLICLTLNSVMGKLGKSELQRGLWLWCGEIKRAKTCCC